MIRNIILIVLFVSIFTGCSNSNSELKNDKLDKKEQFGERKSIHEQDAEKYSDKNSTNKFSDKYKISIGSIKSITDKSIGHFIKPRFTNDGKNIVFTTNNYNQIWLYNLKSELLEKIVEIPQCGNEFQISENGNDIYFRNRAKNGKKKGGTYSFFRYSIKEKKMDVIYSSENRISLPKYNSGNLFFTENDIAKSLNISTQIVYEKFHAPYFYVKENILLRLHNRVDTILVNDAKFKFIKCNYSRDGKYISALTSNNGSLIIDVSGDLIKQFPSALSNNILNSSNLVVFTEESDDGEKILDSKMKIGFTNSDKTFDLSGELNENVFNPNWSPSDNKIAFNSEDGLIKIISLKIENK